jgi:hypothetical protein
MSGKPRKIKRGLSKQLAYEKNDALETFSEDASSSKDLSIASSGRGDKIDHSFNQLLKSHSNLASEFWHQDDANEDAQSMMCGSSATANYELLQRKKIDDNKWANDFKSTGRPSSEYCNEEQ